MKIYKSYKLKNILNIVIFCISLSILLIFSKDNFENVKKSVSIFISSIIPSLFPFIFFTEFILNTDILGTIQKTCGKFLSKFFNISEKSSPAVITGFLCGFPMGAKTVSKLYEDSEISKYEADKLLLFINNCNPAFILSTIGIGIFHNIYIGILLATSHYISSILIGILIRKKQPSTIIHKKVQNLNSFNQNNKSRNENLFEIIKKCIKSTFVTLSMILGFMIIFNLLFCILDNILKFMNISNSTSSIISGLFEVTGGANNVVNSTLDIKTKIIVTSFLLGFSGMCIISQIYSCISKYNFSFNKLVISKFIHGILSMVITYIVLTYTNIIDYETICVYSDIDNYERANYISNMKISYLISTFLIIIFLFIYYVIRKKVAYKNIGHKKEGG